MKETFCRIQITHYPNGEEIGCGGHVLHLMEDLSVIGCDFGPTVLEDGKITDNTTVRFEWYQDRPDIAGFLEITPERFITMTGNGYSGSSYQQSIPDYKREKVMEWIQKFRECNTGNAPKMGCGCSTCEAKRAAKQ